MEPSEYHAALREYFYFETSLLANKAIMGTEGILLHLLMGSVLNPEAQYEAKISTILSSFWGLLHFQMKQFKLWKRSQDLSQKMWVHPSQIQLKEFR